MAAPLTTPSSLVANTITHVYLVLQINQQCKFFKNKTNPLGDLGYDEGALCTPQVTACICCSSNLGACWQSAPTIFLQLCLLIGMALLRAEHHTGM